MLTCAAGRQYAPTWPSWPRNAGRSNGMAKLVLGIGTSHTPMLMAPAEDWPRFIDRDGVREFLDKEGQPATYEELLRRAEPHIAAELTPERFAARHAEAQAGVAHLKDAVRRAELDALIV